MCSRVWRGVHICKLMILRTHTNHGQLCQRETERDKKGEHNGWMEKDACVSMNGIVQKVSSWVFPV